LQTKLKRLLSNEPRLGERIDVYSLDAVGLRLHKSHVGQATIATPKIVREVIQEASNAVAGHKFSLHFLLAEWEQVVDAWQVRDWEVRRAERYGARNCSRMLAPVSIFADSRLDIPPKRFSAKL